MGSIQKILDHLFISATIGAGNFKFGTQLGFREYVTVTTLVLIWVVAGWATDSLQ